MQQKNLSGVQSPHRCVQPGIEETQQRQALSAPRLKSPRPACGPGTSPIQEAGSVWDVSRDSEAGALAPVAAITNTGCAEQLANDMLGMLGMLDICSTGCRSVHPQPSALDQSAEIVV